MTYCTCLYSTISISFYVYKNCTFASYTLYTNVAINHASGKPLYSIAVPVPQYRFSIIYSRTCTSADSRYSLTVFVPQQEAFILLYSVHYSKLTVAVPVS